MNDLLKSVDLRTQLAGNNRMELLTFHLNGGQKYGINVFKVREVMFCPKVSDVNDPYVSGFIYLRGTSMGIIDLNRLIHGEPCNTDNPLLIITEFNKSQQGFMVRSVDRILNLEWGEIHPPPLNLEGESFVTATTEADAEVVQILDVEKVLDMISPTDVNVETDLTDRVQGAMGDEPNRKVVFCDDSAVARRTVNQCLTALGVEGISFENGEQTWNYLQLLAETPGGLDTVICLISDIEMPQLDGFTLTQKIRNHEKLSNLSVYLHSSLSGDFNETRAMQVGADGFITKVNPDLIADSIARSLEQSAEKLRLAAQ